ncbi:hypothetical protein [Aquisalinus flavus]|uniref:Uncharacterized protein n=1 Tax=Aquisalinus flavus TaxID=1526572 RepID=A0A8J2V151_9PROT|nr:hypothetical protein [Aquisalinus flavus]MBD0427349.1 hypothetical protein [Aquisalinus flavus]UNE47154.1 hypothetical protein FF099_03320 [Aquisalinus flavus]GGD00330.1 hypothetical protein GCM10011342_06640 [Aquisalinus flavus]
MLTTVLATIAIMLQLQPGTQPEGDAFNRRDDPCQGIGWLDYFSSAPGFDCEEIARADDVYMALKVGTVAGEPYPYMMLLKSPEQGWRLSAYGYDADLVGEGNDYSWTVTRHGYETTLAPEAVEPFLAAVESGRYAAIPDVDVYPASDTPGEQIICLDGSILIVTIMTEDGLVKGRRHSCAGRTLLDAFAEDLAALVVEAEPVMARYLELLSEDQNRDQASNSPPPGL